MSSAEVTRRASGGASTVSMVWCSRRRATIAARSWPGKSSSAPDHRRRQHHGRRGRQQPLPVHGLAHQAVVDALDRVGDGTYGDHDGIVLERLLDAADDEAGRGHRAQRVVQHDGLVGGLHARPRDSDVDRGHAGVAERPRRAGDQGLAVDQRVGQGAPALVEHQAQGGGQLALVVRVLTHGASTVGPRGPRRDPVRPDMRRGPRQHASGASSRSDQELLRTRGPRRGWPRPCPRWCARPGPARRPGSGGPWPASASRRPTARGRARGATGRGRPPPPS